MSDTLSPLSYTYCNKNYFNYNYNYNLTTIAINLERFNNIIILLFDQKGHDQAYPTEKEGLEREGRELQGQTTERQGNTTQPSQSS